MALILIVAPHASDRTPLAVPLGAAGHALLEAGDADDALVLLEARCPDLLIVHVLLAQMDGPELVRRTRAVSGFEGTPVALLAPDYHEREVGILAEQCGAAAVLTMPVDPDDLRARVRRVLGADVGPDEGTPVADRAAVPQRLPALVERAQRFGSEGDEAALRQEICDAGREFMLARGAALAIAGDDGAEVRTVAASGLALETVAAFPAYLPIDEWRQALVSGRDAIDGARVGSSGMALSMLPVGTAAQPLLVAPVVSGTRVYGWLGIVGKLTAPDFSEDDLVVAQALGRLAGMACKQRRLVADLTARVAHLEADEKRTNFALAAAGTAVWYRDLVTGVVTLSRPVAAMIEGAVEQFQCSVDKAFELVAEEDRAVVRAALEEAVQRHGEFAVEFRGADRSQGVRWFRSIGRLLRGPHGEPKQLLGATIDITNWRSLEQQLRQAQKMEAIGQLAGGVAHDFNNLLTTILGYTRFLLEDLRDEASRRDVEQIARAATRAAALTKQLLAFSRQQMVETTVLDAHAVIADMVDMLRRLIGEHIELATVPGAKLPLVRANRGYFEQVIVNLVVNSRDAMPSGGRIVIRTDNVDVRDPAAGTPDEIRPGHYLRLSVVDTGSGMSDETRARLFEPFFTTKEWSKGTGLGLATVYGIVRQSGGYILVHSELAHGSTFEVYLPVTSEPVPEPVVARAPSGGDEVVLVVEDDADVRELACTMLARAGYRVLAAVNPADAVAAFEAALPHVDLLLTDVVMPGGTGPDLAVRLRGITPHLRVLFMSGYTDTAAEDLAALEREAPFLYKPFNAEALLSAVRTVLDR